MIDDKDIDFLKRLEEYPHLRKRFEEILSVTENDDMITADEAEERAIEEVRKLGQEILHGWALRQHNRQVHKLKKKHPEARKQGKKTLLAVNIWKNRA